MTSEGLGEMFESDNADTCTGNFSLVSMRGQAEGLACADPDARTPIGASKKIGIILSFFFTPLLKSHNLSWGYLSISMLTDLALATRG